jgi:D-3-phosphoglycerate dehydrogenase
MLVGSSGEPPEGITEEPHSIMLRSHKLQSSEVAATVRAIARCGAGTNNIPIDEMTRRGIPVFNTPGANANSVKELALCSLFLAARGVVEGIAHVKEKIAPEEPDHKSVNARIEKDKKHFVGGEITGKTLAVLGLGNIGAMVAESALALGMNVVGYDPKISVDAAWRLPSSVQKMPTLLDAMSKADFVSINMPYIKGVTHGIISDAELGAMKPTCSIINLARGEIVDSNALGRLYEKGHKGKYISDFGDEQMQTHPNFICIPHLGASTAEAEDNCAVMAAEQILKFLETGSIKNSVNFPTTHLDYQDPNHTRLCIINENKPGVLGEITTLLGRLGINITQQLNTSRDAIAYNVVDIEDLSEASAKGMQDQMIAIEGVISTRVIYTGSAKEGPSSFITLGKPPAA